MTRAATPTQRMFFLIKASRAVPQPYSATKASILVNTPLHVKCTCNSFLCFFLFAHCDPKCLSGKAVLLLLLPLCRWCYCYSWLSVHSLSWCSCSRNPGRKSCLPGRSPNQKSSLLHSIASTRTHTHIHVEKTGCCWMTEIHKNNNTFKGGVMGNNQQPGPNVEPIYCHHCRVDYFPLAACPELYSSPCNIPIFSIQNG